MLAYLAMNAGRPIPRAVLADLLWGDRVEAQARQNLRQAILTLRRDLGASCSASLQVDDQSLSLAVETDDVDVLQFAAWAASPDPAQRRRCLEIPWSPFLADLSVDTEPFDEWVIAERHRLDAVATRVFSDLAKQFDAAGDGERAILALERLIAIDPTEEERHRRLLALEARYHGADAALARGRELAAMLKREADAEQEPATVALLEDIRRKGATATDIGVQAAPSAGDRPLPQAKTESHRVPNQTPPELPPWLRWVPRIRLPGGRKAPLVASLTLAAACAAVLGIVATRWPHDRPAVVAAAPDPWQPPGARPVDASGNLVPIAVLPFTLSGGNAAALQPTADILTDDLTNVLSRVPGLRVISRQTMRAYRDRTIDVAAIGTELGVRYVLEGSMHAIGDRLRVNVELIDPRNRSPVWSDRIEREAARHREILDEIVGRLGRQLQMSVAMMEAEHAASDPGVAALVRKGWAAHYSAGTRGLEASEQARSYFTRALGHDPDNVSAKIGLAAVLVGAAFQSPEIVNPEDLDRAEALLHEALLSSPRTTGAHYYTGILYRARGRPRQAIESFERAIEINPSHAPSYAHKGFILSRIGEPAKGLEYIRYAMRLSPKDPVLSYWHNFAGFAEIELEQDDRAIESFSRALGLRPRYLAPHVGLIAAYALSGKLDQAHRTLAELQAFAPQLSRERIIARFGADRGSVQRRLTRGLELALAPSTADTSWQSPPLPSRAADNSIARGRGLVAIAVLPFRLYNENGAGGTLVADMVTEDLTYLLSRVPLFRVISRQTASTYRGQNIDAGAIGAELSVRYLVEGGVSVHGSILRVNVALVDTKTRLQIWTGRFERTGADRHTMQAEIVNGLARELQVSVSTVERGRTSKNPDVHELIFKGLAAIDASRHHGVEGLRPAEGYFLQALARDPDAVRAQIGLGAYHAHMAVQLFAPDPAPHLEKAEAILQQVIDRHPDLSEAYAPMGLVYVARNDFRRAMGFFERTIELNPSAAPSYAQLGRALARLGQLQAGLDHIRYAMQLSPRDPLMGYWLAFAGYAALELERYEEAVEYLGRAHATNPTQPRTALMHVAALAMAGRMSEARLKLKQLRKTHPHFTLERIAKMYSNAEGRIRTSEGIGRVLAVENAQYSGAIK